MDKWKPIQHESPSEPIILYHGSSEIIDRENIIKGISNIQFVWYPFPRITMKFTYSGEDEINLEEIELKLNESLFLSNLKFHLYKFTYYKSHRESGKKEILGYLIEDIKQGKITQLSSIVFHIPNFWWFNISNDYYTYDDEQGNEIEVYKEGWGTFLGQFIFEYNNWHIVLAALDDSFEMEEKLKEQGGYGITHVCKIKRLDNKEFNLDKANQIIEAFIYYLSFVRGIWLAPILLSGLDANGNEILKEWSASKIKADSWHYGYKWADIDFNMDMAVIETFPGFMSKWQDDIWQEVIQNAIQWYIESLKHFNGYNTSIVLVQAALEKLAWTYLSSNECISSEGFTKITVDDKIRLLLKFLNIPIISLEENPELSRTAKERNWIDSINMIGKIRNLIIHPKVKRDTRDIEISEEIMNEVLTISREYLLKILLKLFEYPYSLD